MAERVSNTGIRVPHHQVPRLHGRDFKVRHTSRDLPLKAQLMQSPQTSVSQRRLAKTPKLKPGQNIEAILKGNSVRPKKKSKEKPIQIKARERKRLFRNKTVGFLAGAAFVLAACYASPNEIPAIDQVDSWKIAFEKNPLYFPQMLALFFGTSAGISTLITSGVKHGAKAADPNVHGYNWLNFGFDWGVDVVSDATVAGYQAASAMLMYEFGVADRAKIFEKIASQIPALAALGFAILAFNQFDKVKDVIGLLKFPQLTPPAAPATEEE